MRRRRLLLFVLLVFVPGAVLIAATLRLARQEQELAVQRQRDARVLLALQLGQELRTGLDRLHVDTMLLHPAVVARGRLDGTRLVLPWEAAAPRAPVPTDVAELMGAAARAEFGAQHLREAAELYGRAARLGQTPELRAEALLLRGRALRRAGMHADARTVYRTLAAEPAFVRDAEGLPVALYAADALLALGDTAATLDALAGLVGTADLAPTALYAAHGLAAQVGTDALAAEFAEQLSLVERIMALRQDLPSLLALAARAPGRPDRVWLPFGGADWLIGLPGSETPDAASVVVARAGPSLGDVATASPDLAEAASQARLTDLDAPGAASPGPGFAGVGLLLPGDFPTSQAAFTGRLLALTLPLVLGLMLFTAYLLWRDVRREVAAAALRARFVSSVSHELKTPLTSIRMFAEMLRYGHLPAARRDEYLDIVVNESERLTRLINNVLDFSRIDRGDRPYQRTTLLLDDVVSDAARAMAYPLAQDGFELNLHIDDDVPPVLAERDAIIQAVLNLLSNALKFSGSARSIDLELRRAGDAAVIRVTDRGSGVRADERRAIFEPYYRSPDAQSAGVPGTGLGLALVAHVARGHDGSVDVATAPGGGSTFSLRIPLALAHQAAAPAVTPARGAAAATVATAAVAASTAGAHSAAAAEAAP
jgi:signal transduction histidine kinase